MTRNRAIEWAEKGARVALADPEVEKKVHENASIMYCLGFQVATGVYGDPALGAQGNTATGPGGLKIRDDLANADAIRGFNDAVGFHLGPPLRPRQNTG